jgi:hypothetical protein
MRKTLEGYGEVYQVTGGDRRKISNEPWLIRATANGLQFDGLEARKATYRALADANLAELSASGSSVDQARQIAADRAMKQTRDFYDRAGGPTFAWEWWSVTWFPAAAAVLLTAQSLPADQAVAFAEAMEVRVIVDGAKDAERWIDFARKHQPGKRR